jgi:hypothetical protein
MFTTRGAKKSMVKRLACDSYLIIEMKKPFRGGNVMETAGELDRTRSWTRGRESEKEEDGTETRRDAGG